MTFLLSWIVFPLVLVLVCAGCGLLVERVAGYRMPGALVLPAGFAGLVVVAYPFTVLGPVAPFGPLAVALVAIAGAALTRPWRDRRPDPWALAAALAVFMVFSAPAALSGEATFAGYIKLDDTATWLALTDRVSDEGRSLDGLAPSTYEATLDYTLGEGYPVGSFLALGVGSTLVGQDPVWTFQPLLSVLAALLALSLYGLAARAVASARLRAGLAFVAAQPALLFSYALWGALKELTAVVLLALLAATALAGARRLPGSARVLVPAAVATAATVAVLSPGGAIWLLPILLVAGGVALRRAGVRGVVKPIGAFALGVVVLTLPALVGLGSFLKSASKGLTDENDLGNLVEPLNPLQTLGVWPAGDMRVDPVSTPAAVVLLIAVAAAGVAGVVLLWQSRRTEGLLFAGGIVAGGLVVALFGSPWIDGKAMATVSPALLFLAAAGCALLAERGRRLVPVVLGVLILAGVLWSNALAYRDVWLAPGDQHAELQNVEERVAGEGPLLLNEYEPYGARHFLREADAEAPAELRVRTVALTKGGLLGKGQQIEIDQFALEGLAVYRTIVLRRSPAESRPPAPYELTWRGHFYDVWQRPAGKAEMPLAHLPLGEGREAAAPAGCPQVLRLARLAGPAGELAAVPRSQPIVTDLPPTTYPEGWQPDRTDPGLLYPDGGGRLEADVTVPDAGSFEVWLGGSFRGRVVISVDGREIGSDRHRLNSSGQYTSFGTVKLDASIHRLEIDLSGADLHPGSGGPLTGFGPLTLAPVAPRDPLVRVPTEKAGELCGRSLDWVEALGPSRPGS